MRRLVSLAIVVGLVLVGAAPATAAEVRKETTKFRESIDDVIPAGIICDFEVGIQEEIKLGETAWFDSEDNLLKGHITVNGTTVWSGPGGIATEHWSWSGWFDPVTFTFSQSGNVWNVHQNGLVIHDKGLIVFDEATGDVLKVAGPHEVFFDGLGALCEAIG